MYGKLIDAIAYTIRHYPNYSKYNLNVIKGNDTRGKAIVNTSLPCAVIVPIESSEPITFIGGQILDKIIIEVSVCTELINTSITEDNGIQSEFTDMAYELLMFLESEMSNPVNPYFRTLRDKFNFSDLYKGFKTYTSIATVNNTKTDIQIFAYRFSVNVLQPSSICGQIPKDYKLKNVELQSYDTNTITNEDEGEPQTTKIPK